MYLNWESYVLKLGVRIPWTGSPEYLDWESGPSGLCLTDTIDVSFVFADYC